MSGNTGPIRPSRFFIGWDVGGWNCDKNSQSRDAIVILDWSLSVVGTPWRGNLRELINGAVTTDDWINGLFKLCQTDRPVKAVSAVCAIDTPLGFSREFRNLLNNHQACAIIGDSQDNPYLYRETERFLFRQGRRPLSPIKDMIGSQATKGMHVLAKFAPKIQSCGVWSDGRSFRALEGYPSAARDTPVILELRQSLPRMSHDDTEDALVCALVAYLFAEKPDALEAPGADVLPEEGWIWVPHKSASGTSSPRVKS